MNDEGEEAYIWFRCFSLKHTDNENRRGTVLQVNLIEGAEDYRTMTVECQGCSEHRFVKIPFKVVVGKVIE